ncbi:MAG TPA: hypothetical protein VGM94_12820 [Galbitalea sp.]|jgi:hypothetical protein
MTKLEDAILEIVRAQIETILETTTVHIQREVRIVDDRRLYSVANVAKLFEVSKAWVYERINRGELTVVELGGTTGKQRIAAPEVQRYIDSRTFGRKP